MLGRATFVLLACLPVAPALADPLGGGRPASAQETVLWVPEAAAPLLSWLTAMQREAMTILREQIAALQDDVSLAPALSLILIGFLYGIVHAAGPGHGKFVVGGYFLTRQARLSAGLMLSAGMALTQALSAILLVAFFSFAVSAGSQRLMEQAGLLETISYGLIALLGLGLAWNSLKGKSCCHDPNCQHGHDKPPLRGKELLAASLAVGLRPCSGALLILLFTFANHLAWIGILATLAMAAGTFMTVSGVSFGAIGLQMLFARLGIGTAHAALMRRIAGMGGGLLILLAGLAMMAASLPLAAE